MIPFLITLQEFAVMFIVLWAIMTTYIGIHNHGVSSPSNRIRVNTASFMWYSAFIFVVLMLANSATPELF